MQPSGCFGIKIPSTRSFSSENRYLCSMINKTKLKMENSIKLRLNALRSIMKEAGVQATIIPQTDPHQSEYLAAHWQVRRFLSGFTGSAGSLVVTLNEALLWTDSRYFIQAAAQLEGTGIILMKDGLEETPSIAQYLCGTLNEDNTVGIDGMLFSENETKSLRSALGRHGIKLMTTFDVIDEIWNDRPALPKDKIFIHEQKYAGQSAADKISKVLKGVKDSGANAILISALDEIAWLLNIRCNDVNCNPVATAFLYLSTNGNTLFIDNEKLEDSTRRHLSDAGVNVLQYNDIIPFLEALPKGRVLVDENRTVTRLCQAIGSNAQFGQSPVALLKACKNDVQIEGVKAAMKRDGVAMVKSLMEIEKRMKEGVPTTELDVADILLKYRKQGEHFFDISFETIAGYGPHGAIVHYEATPETSSTLQPRGILLIDSGAQYLDGTTDITRTIALGPTTAMEREDFTLVMKGHICLATITFPEGTRGGQLDALARQFLWRRGLSYLHGTGHGVGHFLNVHEGPQSIRLNDVPTPLKPGMITSNEPGVYRENLHGIRCENLVLTVPAFENEFGKFLKFETLTLCPFDPSLFVTEMMSREEIDWVDSYHQAVYETLAPELDGEAREWLKEKTAPLIIA